MIVQYGGTQPWMAALKASRESAVAAASGRVFHSRAALGTKDCWYEATDACGMWNCMLWLLLCRVGAGLGWYVSGILTSPVLALCSMVTVALDLRTWSGGHPNSVSISVTLSWLADSFLWGRPWTNLAADRCTCSSRFMSFLRWGSQTLPAYSRTGRTMDR